MKLWLDDERDPKDPAIQRLFGAPCDAIWIKTSPEMCRKIEELAESITYISLDNDLGDNFLLHGEGYLVAEFIERGVFTDTLKLNPGIILKCHSMNSVRAAQIKGILHRVSCKLQE